MIIIDSAISKRHSEKNPVKIGILGSGAMAKGLIQHINSHDYGIKVVCTYGRNLKKLQTMFDSIDINDYQIADSTDDVERAFQNNLPAICTDADILIKSDVVDLVVEMTGAIEFGAKAILSSFEYGKHVLSFNAELDATLGPYLVREAKKAGLKYSVADGDQPGVSMNLYRYVKGIGLKPLVIGNIKGMLDRYRNPFTQEGFAKKWGMQASMVTNFADGTKLSLEQACIANATDSKVAITGMYGYESKEHIDQLTHLFDYEELLEKGSIVDYILGAKPGPGVFIYAASEHKYLSKFLEYSKLGKGPLYSFYVPYHLLYLEIPNSIIRLMDYDDSTLEPQENLNVEVVSLAKKDLNPGDLLDGIGGYAAYGICENSDQVDSLEHIPIGLTKGIKLKNSVSKDKFITFKDVEIPASNYLFNLYKKQLTMLKRKNGNVKVTL